MRGEWAVDGVYDRAKAMWSEGKSASQIGAAIGVSRSAVCSMAMRQNWGRRIPGRKGGPQPRLQTAERNRLVTELWPTASLYEIADRLGVDPSYVRRIARKLGLQAKNHRRAAGRVKARKPTARQRDALAAFLGRQPFAGMPRPTKPRQDIAEPTSLNVALVDLGPHHCRWPHGDGPFTFCGYARFGREVYCESHCRLAYNAMRAA